MNVKLNRALHNIICNAGQLKVGENFLIVSDHQTKEIGLMFQNFCIENSFDCDHKIIAPLLIHGAEPQPQIGNLFTSYELVAGLTRFSMAHSQARKLFTNQGGRYLSLPDFDLDVLYSKSLEVNFFEQRQLASQLAKLLAQTKVVHVTTDAGTDLYLTIKGREPNNCDCILDAPGKMASPPDIEVNVAPLELETKGRIVVDSSIPHPDFGLLQSPITLEFEQGYIRTITSDKSYYVEKLEHLFQEFGDKSRIVGELGFGLNPYAKPTGKMLEDEGAKGFIHFGLGSNITIGGCNEVSVHLDCVCGVPNVWFDDVLVIKQGNYMMSEANEYCK